AVQMFGYTALEILGQHIDILRPAEERDGAPSLLHRRNVGQRIQQLETIRVRKGGERFPVSITVSPIWGRPEPLEGAPTMVGVSTIVRDITEHKAAEASADRERRFANTLIESMPGVFYLYDENGRFLR